MKQIGAYEAKTHLSKLLDEVAKGQELCITKKGHPVALLVPLTNKQALSPKEAIQKIKELRQGITLEGLSLKKMIREGRKY